MWFNIKRNDFRVFYPYPTDYRSDSVGNDIEMEQHIQIPMKHIVDCILFRGSWVEQNRLAPRPDHIYADTVYLNELIRREKIVDIPPYRTRLYFYNIFESKDFIPFENALTGTDMIAIDSLFHPLKALIPENKIMDVLIYTGQFYLGKKETLKSIAVFRFTSGIYPDHFLTFVNLGDAYLAINEVEQAEKYYKEALLRNPESNFIENKIETLVNK